MGSWLLIDTLLLWTTTVCYACSACYTWYARLLCNALLCLVLYSASGSGVAAFACACACARMCTGCCCFVCERVGLSVCECCTPLGGGVLRWRSGGTGQPGGESCGLRGRLTPTRLEPGLAGWPRSRRLSSAALCLGTVWLLSCLLPALSIPSPCVATCDSVNHSAPQSNPPPSSSPPPPVLLSACRLACPAQPCLPACLAHLKPPFSLAIARPPPSPPPVSHCWITRLAPLPFYFNCTSSQVTAKTTRSKATTGGKATNLSLPRFFSHHHPDTHLLHFFLTMTDEKRSSSVYLAKLAEQAERYEGELTLWIWWRHGQTLDRIATTATRNL